MVGLCWRLDIGKDGSAKVRYQEGAVEQTSEVVPETFKNFENLVGRLTELSPLEWQGDRNLVVFCIDKANHPVKEDTFGMLKL